MADGEHSSKRKRASKAYKENPFGTWEEGDPTLYWVRGLNYKDDKVKELAQNSACRLVHLDLFRSKRIREHIFPKTRSAIPADVGVKASRREFWVIFNFIVPAHDHQWYNWVAYYALPRGTRKKEENTKFFHAFDEFIKGDTKERNNRVKMIASVAEGPWIVKALLGGQHKDGTYKGAKPAILGNLIHTSYYQGDDYVEVVYNAGSDKVASHACKTAIPHSKKLILDVAFTIQGENEDELPEKLLGTLRCSYFDLSDDAVEKFPFKDDDEHEESS